MKETSRSVFRVTSNPRQYVGDHAGVLDGIGESRPAARVVVDADDERVGRALKFDCLDGWRARGRRQPQRSGKNHQPWKPRLADISPSGMGPADCLDDAYFPCLPRAARGCRAGC